MVVIDSFGGQNGRDRKAERVAMGLQGLSTRALIFAAKEPFRAHRSLSALAVSFYQGGKRGLRNDQGYRLFK